MEKTCFKCNIVKPLGEFYKHKKMGDGHLGKCKTCTKKDVDEREKHLRATSPEFVEKETIRAREKYFRLGYKDIHKPDSETKKRDMAKYKEKYPEKIKAQQYSQHIRPINKENQMHHWSYNEIHFKDVIELSVLEHKKLHRYIVYDQEQKMYRRIDNLVLLDTKEAHIAYYESLKDKP